MFITEVVDSDFGFSLTQVLRGSYMYEQVNDFFGRLIDLDVLKQDAINAHAQ